MQQIFCRAGVALDLKAPVARHELTSVRVRREPGIFKVKFAAMSMLDSDDERITLERELQLLNQEHRDLDAAIFALERLDIRDQLQIQRLKKRKLALKDRIVLISGKLRPDIIA